MAEAPAPSDRSAVDLVALEPPTLLDRARLVAGERSPASVAAGLLVALAVALASWLVLRPAPPPVEDLLPYAPGATGTAVPAPAAPDPASSVSPAATSGPVVVHVAGAVVVPGVHELPPGARVADALDAAGGAATDADLDRLNLAAPLADGGRLYVPRRGEAELPVVVGPDAPPADPAGGATEGVTPLVDLNHASLDELDELPGVGPATAQAILDHRSAAGPFTSVDQLLDVRGIGEAKLAELRPLVTVG